jgi:hypothetical protein
MSSYTLTSTLSFNSAGQATVNITDSRTNQSWTAVVNNIKSSGTSYQADVSLYNTSGNYDLSISNTYINAITSIENTFNINTINGTSSKYYAQCTFSQYVEDGTVIVAAYYTGGYPSLQNNVNHTNNSDGTITYSFENNSEGVIENLGTVTCTKLYNNGTQTGCKYVASASNNYYFNYQNMCILANMGLADCLYEGQTEYKNLINAMFALAAYPVYEIPKV